MPTIKYHYPPYFVSEMLMAFPEGSVQGAVVREALESDDSVIQFITRELEGGDRLARFPSFVVAYLNNLRLNELITISHEAEQLTRLVKLSGYWRDRHQEWHEDFLRREEAERQHLERMQLRAVT